MIFKLLRVVIGVAGALFGYGVSILFIFMSSLDVFGLDIVLSDNHKVALQIASPIFFGIIFFLLTPLFKRTAVKATKNIEADLQKVPSTDIAAGTVGLIVGLIIAFLISQLLSSIEFLYLGTILSLLTYIFMGYLGITIATKKGGDIIPNWIAARMAATQGHSKKVKAGVSTPKILDTSVIIDGRIADIMKTGFLEGNIVIPEFVLLELQHIADSSDSLKRNRGRRGLDVLNKIQQEYGVEIYNCSSEKSLAEIPEVDTKLLKLAQIMNGKVVTNDFNLNKVAEIKGVDVLNINSLSNALKPVVLPGEDMQLFLVKEGKENNQGVAYLDDGTMIVVEDGRKFIGQTINATVTSVLQTSAGRMIFAKPKVK